MFDAYSLFFSKYGCSIFVINKSLISISQHIVDDHDRRQTQVVNCQKTGNPAVHSNDLDS